MQQKGKKSTKNEILILERRMHVLEFAKAGFSIRKISAMLKNLHVKDENGNQVLKYPKNVSPTTVHADLKAILGECQKQFAMEVDDYRTLQQTRLESLWQAIYTKALKGQSTAINTALNVHDRLTKLIGLDAPTKLEVTPNALAQLLGVEPDELPK